MTTTLITGANKGIGRETARRLVAAGHTVYVGARDAERGRRAAEELGARFVLLDVTDDATVDAAVKAVEADGGLDVLINNAGIETRGEGNAVPTAETVTADQMRNTFETNVFGVVRVLHAFLPLLQRSAAPVVVNVSSGLASLANLSDPDHPAHFYPGIAYPTSKTAVNMLTVQYAKAFPAMRINAVEPGFTKTDLNGNTGHQTVEQGAEIIVRMAQIGPDGPTGGFFDVNGPLPW
ncbi:SDR family NAD(P)-dependent oxidoreductase [Streptomyces spinosirectus]|jgi:NAD(P)-dependent dehydrogenase (short-subunit alcohol dehydrogenase family)|uniref:SDR family NAD(P)-dependent oxidoreductase n=1 Tax=Streptomyces TaxID=1883 RepID=UPI000D38578C|nr:MULTISPECIES: SDR family NAD(P)-dependent oxidoreductase [Streptomyces]MBY8339217.1 SDR family NAD(P)-dependent oxidoreductase [Streptomyces plumbidurans]PTM94016.1 NAD(P)-dependent dehydrogenase (short-subunit alcohol dehydrogenase family) [Streptomyces sp. VMFN-G11Ma]UIR21988.1 SDR family NAD(P)-dependent oxidoreductase [Streptomyces spinosirectus]